MDTSFFDDIIYYRRFKKDEVGAKAPKEL